MATKAGKARLYSKIWTNPRNMMLSFRHSIQKVLNLFEKFSSSQLMFDFKRVATNIWKISKLFLMFQELVLHLSQLKVSYATQESPFECNFLINICFPLPDVQQPKPYPKVIQNNSILSVSELKIIWIWTQFIKWLKHRLLNNVSVLLDNWSVL